MRVLHGIERRLAGAVNKTFARIFGGAVQPAEVTAALHHEAAGHLTRHDSRIIAPNRYIVELGPSDSAQVSDDIARVNSAFSTMLGAHLRDQGWDTFAPVAVTFDESDQLHTGQFRIRSLIDPGTSAPAIYDAPAPSSLARVPGASYPHPAGYPTPPTPQYQAPQYQAPQYPQPAPAAYPAQQPAPAAYPAQQPAYPAQQPAYPAQQPAPQPAPRLIAQDGTGRSHVLRRGSNIVGRGPDAALRLADQAVSRHHIDVYFDGRVAIVHDLGSTNGTSVNGGAIQTWQLADGDVITLGQSSVLFAGR